MYVYNLTRGARCSVALRLVRGPVKDLEEVLCTETPLVVRVPLGLVQRWPGAPIEGDSKHQLRHELVHPCVRVRRSRGLPVWEGVREGRKTSCGLERVWCWYAKHTRQATRRSRRGAYSIASPRRSPLPSFLCPFRGVELTISYAEPLPML